MMVERRYEYACRVIRLVDGDTIDLDVDLGFRLRMNDRFRLWHPAGRFNAPEVRGEETEMGLEATAFATQWIDLYGPDFTVRTHQDRRGGFGRWLADLIAADGTKLTDAMLDSGHAKIRR